MADHQTVAAIVAAAERPGAPALFCGSTTLSFADLDRRSSRVACALAADGVRPGSRVALLDRNSGEHFEVLFGCAKLGAAFVPVNWRLAPREVDEVLADATAEVLIIGAEFVADVLRLRESGGLRSIRTMLVLGESGVLPSYDEWRDAHPARPVAHRPSPDDVVLQMYTSGTTGVPKGVLLTHRNLCGAARVASGWGLNRPGATALVCMPLFHMSGTSWGMLALFHGAGLVVLRDADPRGVVDAIAGHRITHGLLVPTLLRMVLELPDVAPAALASLRVVVYGGSPIAPELLVTALERLRCEFIQLYGLTESTGLATILPPGDHAASGEGARLLRSVGRPGPGVELRIVDEDGRDCAPGAVGEVWLRSPQVMAGYWRKPVETADVLVGDGWLRTGDAAYSDEDGYVFIVDRVKDMVVTGGENVYPAEVERVLVEHPGVAEVAVIGVPDAKWGECVTAVVVPTPGALLTAEDVVDYTRERLAHYKCPRRVEFVDALPRNATGKVLKRTLRDDHWAGHDRRVS